MKDRDRTSFSERLKAAAAAKGVLLAKLRPRPAITSPQAIDRLAERQAALAIVRQVRIVAKAARAQAKAEATAASATDLEVAALATKRQDRKARKALRKTIGRAKRTASR